MPSPGAGAWLAALGLLLLLLLLAGPGLRGERMTGGLSEAPASDPGVQAAVRFAVEAYNRASNGLRYCRAERVQRARTQVVAGIKYYLTILLVTTQCQKNGAGLGNVDVSKCPLPPASEQQRLLCDFQVWSRPWLNQTQLSSKKCSVFES